MQITRIRALRGPNLWTRSTAIEAIVQCAPEEHDISQLPGLEDRLRARFPQIGALQPQGAGQSVSLADVLEDGGLADALAAMQQAQERVSEAIRFGASKDEIAKLMQELRQAMQEYNAEVLVRGGDMTVLEGQMYARTVVLKFESVAQARAFYDSETYRKARELRKDAAIANIAIVEGI